MRTLILDDSSTVRKMLRRIMEEAGYEVTEAENGREGLERLREMGQVDVALVDWHMPEMDGLEFIKTVRTDPAYNGVRFMMVTTEVHTEQVVEALEAGADEYVMKPFQKDTILEKLTILGLRTE